MTIRHMTIFKTVCKYESITKAAEELNMTQPAVSYAMKELEAYYQTQFFERMNRRIYLTDSGRLYLEYVTSILEQMEEARHVLQEDNPASPIRMGCNIAVATSWLPQFLSEFQKKYPAGCVQTQIANSGEIEKAVQKHELDFGILDVLSGQEQLYQKELILQEPVVAVCSPEFFHTYQLDEIIQQNGVLSVAELGRLPLLLREKGSGTREAVSQMFEQKGVQPERIAVESSSSVAMLRFCFLSQGITFATLSTVSEMLESGQLIRLPLDSPEYSRSYYLVMHKNKYVFKTMKILIRELKEYVRINFPDVSL